MAPQVTYNPQAVAYLQARHTLLEAAKSLVTHKTVDNKQDAGDLTPYKAYYGKIAPQTPQWKFIHAWRDYQVRAQERIEATEGDAHERFTKGIKIYSEMVSIIDEHLRAVDAVDDYETLSALLKDSNGQEASPVIQAREKARKAISQAKTSTERVKNAAYNQLYIDEQTVIDLYLAHGDYLEELFWGVKETGKPPRRTSDDLPGILENQN